MQTLMANTKGLTLLLNLNWDRILYLGMIFGSLFLGAWIGAR